MMNIYQHFKEDEQEFIDQVLDWVVQVENFYAPYLSPFLNPRQVFILESIVGQYDDIEVTLSGGYKEAEQVRAFIHPPYFEPKTEDFEISVIEINYPEKFAELSHGQIMGTILGTGIVRETLGDIITNGERWQFFIDKKMEKFIFLNMDKVGRTNVQLESTSFDDVIQKNDDWEIEEIIISSLRLDVVLAGALNVSRNRTKTMINENKVKLNWVETKQVDLEVEEYDLLSVRGFGRIQVRKKLGTTRKDNLILEIGIISRNR